MCWNNDIGQCVTCSPIVADELSKAQAAVQIDQLKEKVKETDWTTGIDTTTRAKVSCPHCGAAVAGGKFCGSCGGKLAATSFCSECGSELAEGVKFCPECGTAAPA